MTDEAANHTIAIFAVPFSLVYIEFVPVTNVKQPVGLKTASVQRLNGIRCRPRFLEKVTILSVTFRANKLSRSCI